MTLAIALRDGAGLGAVIALLAALAEVLGIVAGLMPAYQRATVLALLAYALPLYGATGLIGGAFVGALLWLAGAGGRWRAALVALHGAGWVLALGAITVHQLFRQQETPAATLVILDGGVLLAAVAVGALFWGLERLLVRWRLPLARSLPGRRGVLVGTVLLSATWSVRQWGATAPAVPAPAGAPNVILIVLDTTRADHLSAYGYGRPTSPILERLAREGARFDAASAPSSWTLPSLASLMTALLPSTHGADHGHWLLDDDRLTLAEILREQGYATGGFVGGPFAKAAFGLAQGFDTYDDALTPPVMNLALVRATAKQLPVTTLTRPERSADQINEVVFPWLRRHGQRPFFLFINYFDPHDPYQPPGEYARRWATAGGLDGDVERALLVRRVVRDGGQLSPAEREQLLGLYDGEIAFMDAQLGRLVDALATLGVLDRSVLIVTADHGESFGEHQLLIHGNALYEDQVRVPLIIRFPSRVRAGVVVPTPVRSLDVFPTVLDLLGLPPPSGLHGQSLLPLLGSTASAAERTLVAELRPADMWRRLNPRFDRELLALRQGPWKYIASSVGTVELYHLAEDPGELDNLVLREPDQVARFQREALRWMTRRDARGPRGPLDRATRDQLKALGY